MSCFIQVGQRSRLGRLNKLFLNNFLVFSFILCSSPEKDVQLSFAAWLDGIHKTVMNSVKEAEEMDTTGTDSSIASYT